MIIVNLGPIGYSFKQGTSNIRGQDTIIKIPIKNKLEKLNENHFVADKPVIFRGKLTPEEKSGRIFTCVKFLLTGDDRSYRRVILLWVEERNEWVAIIYKRWKKDFYYEESYKGPYKLGRFCENKLIEAYDIDWQWSTSLESKYTSPQGFIQEIINHAVLTKIKIVYITHKEIETLPAEIGKLNEVKHLDLGHNKLTKLPPEIWDLRNLEKLDLRENELRSLPPDIRNFSKLRLLSLRKNKLVALPNEIGDLTNIESVELTKNEVTEVPKEIGQLNDLRYLHLGENRITSLPIEFLKLHELKELYLFGNKIPIPPEILGKWMEPKTILNYYFQAVYQKIVSNEISENAVKSLNQTKLLFIGQGSVGKTSLIQQIIHGTFNQSQTKTEGISLIKWQVQPTSNENNTLISVNIWDFGGQEIMHATHQFFLTKRSLYLLVLDARLGQDENRVEYWLRLIQSFGGDSPVIVVGNKIDQQSLDIDRRGLQAKYPNIKAFFETSCLDGQGIKELKEAISRELFKLPHVHDLLPESWFQVKEKLEKLDKDFIPYSEYEALCDKDGITDETSQSTLIGFLHDLGSVLNFRDDPRLQETNILNPKWVTNGVYCILNSNDLFQKKGVLETKQLSKMLDRKAYPKSRHMFIVDMMRKFELCYPFEGDDGKYLVPDLLPREEPFTGDWADALAFEFHYSVLPGSIISRFIVRTHPFIHQHTVWRAGVVLKSGENTTLVKADYEDKKIFIRVTGERETRRDALSMVRGTLDDIHKTITGLEAAPKVPHPDYPELVLDYDELIEFEKQGIDSFPRKVGPQVVTVNVKQLLDGVEGTSAPQVFISYSRKDQRFANKVAKHLTESGITVWQDQLSIDAGTIWADEIGAGILQCKIFLILLSPDSVESEWVKKEYTYALASKRKVVPALYKECELPFALTNIQMVSFTSGTQKEKLVDLVDLLRDNL